MSDISIRQSVPFDLEAILSIERGSAEAAHWSPETYQRIWSDLEARRVAFVAEFEGEVVGFVVGREIAGEWELENIAVAQRAQRQGVGRMLTLRLVATARALAGTRMFLEVRASNLPAQKLYKSLGFSSSGRRKNYYTDPEEDALIFEKTLVGTV